jgi:hypothetical protein
MMVFVTEEAKARTVKRKSKHPKSNWYNQFQGMTITLLMSC